MTGPILTVNIDTENKVSFRRFEGANVLRNVENFLPNYTA